MPSNFGLTTEGTKNTERQKRSLWPLCPLWLIFLIGCAAWMLIGCDRRNNEGSAPATPATGSSVRTGMGTIRGTVTLTGKPPVMQTIPNQPCHAGAGQLNDESVIVDSSGHLRNVVVYMESPPPAPPAANSAPPVLNQVNCQYVPHVLALRTGQTLRVTTSDPTLHNVHGLCSENEPFNFALIAPGQTRDLKFDRPEAFQIRCDVHPWMRAYVHVFDHPYFAVTGKDGTFEIKGVPAGSCTLVAWQEKYGLLRMQVTAADDKISPADFTFRSGL